MIIARWLVWISLLVCLLLEPPVIPQPLPPSADRTLAEALHLVQAARFKDALDLLRQLYTPPRRDVLSLDWQRRLSFLLGYLSFQVGDDHEAVLHLEHAQGTYPELRDYTLRYLGEAFMRMDRTQQARAAMEQLLEAFPDSVHRREALFQVAEASIRLGDLPRARDLYEMYQRQYPDVMQHGQVHLRLGMLQRDLGDPEGALHEWRHIWLEHPEDPAAALVPDLERTLPMALMVPPVTSEHLYRRAERLYRLGRHLEALKAFELARAAAPEQVVSAEVLHHIGMAQYHARQNDAAVLTFRQLFEGAPHGPLAPIALLMLARLHLRLEVDAQFLDIAQALVAQFPGSQEAEEVRYLVGHFHRNRGRVAEAMQAFQRVVRRDKWSRFADDALWYLGWVQYGVGEYQQALQTWGKLLKTFPSSALVPDALYWQGRAFERLGRRAKAQGRYERLRTSHPQTYYGHLATARLTGLTPWPWQAQWPERHAEAIGITLSAPEPLPIASSNAHALRGAELWTMRLYAEAGEELQAVPASGAEALRLHWRAAQAFHWAGEPHRALNLLRRHDRATLLHVIGPVAGDLQEMTFPLRALHRLENLSLDGLDPRFIGALVMAESSWNPDAFSRVGARGLMQLMPETGRRLARDLGLDLLSEDQLFNPSLNLQLGIAYVRQLLRRFDHHLPLAVASFNAGEQEVSKWWARHGDLDLEEFIADIPFRETRQYVQRVLVYYAAYLRIYRERSS